MSCSNEPDAAESAVRLRQRVRALAAGQTAAFDLLCYEFGGGSAIGATIGRSGDRLGRLAALLADVAWTLGDHGAAYDGAPPPPAPEAEAVQQLFRHHANARRRYVMSMEQRTAVLAYLDALLAEVSGCFDLDAHAPSPTLAREARRFVDDFTGIRDAAILMAG